MARKALAKKITKKQARSYSRLVPNGLGVTTLAAVNGRGAYAKRYAATRKLLGHPKEAKVPRYASNRVKGRLTRAQYMRRVSGKGLSKAQREGLWSGYQKLSAYGAAKPIKKKKATKRKPARRKATARRAPAKRKAPVRRKKAAPKRKKAATRRKTTRRAAPKRKARRRATPKPRVYGGGRYRSVTARIGSRTRRTPMYQSKRGVRKIPTWALLGYQSYGRAKRAYMTDEDQQAWIDEQMLKIQARRDKAADKIRRRGGLAIAPNKRRRRKRPTTTYSYEEWEAMRLNPRRRRRRKKATRKNAKRRTTKASRRAAALKGWRKRRRSGTAPKKRRKKRRVVRARGRTVVVRPNRRRRRKAATRRRAPVRRNRRRRAAPKRRRVRRNRHLRANVLRQMGANRRRRRTKRTRRNYRRNMFTTKTYQRDLLKVLKVGAYVTAGFIAHRALTAFVSENVLSNIGLFQTGFLGRYRDSVAGALVAAVGIPLAARLPVKAEDVRMVGAGMAASWIQGIITNVAVAMDAPMLAATFAGYPNAPGSAQYSGMGAYYEFEPHQMMGMGEYYSTDGFGQLPHLQQAAAGMGQLQQAQLTQAAAGMGAMVTQAAAGAGEYVITGAAGIGEYEEVTPEYTRPAIIDEGIAPDLTSAEYALSVAEAAAGINGFGADVPLQSTVEPGLAAPTPLNIPDMPGGSRAGILAGPNGVFG